jgi:WD40 repeat protein
LLAVADPFAVSIRDSETDEELYRLDTVAHRDFLTEISFGGTLAFSPDGKYLAHISGTELKEVGYADMIVWRTSDFTKIGDGPLFKTNCGLTAVAFSSDSSRMFVCDEKGVVEIWNTADWTKQDSIQTSHGPGTTIAISSDGTRLAAASNTTEAISIWDIEAGEEVRQLRTPKVFSLAFAPNDRTLAAGCENHDAILWDVESGKRLQTFIGHSDIPGSIAFSKDGHRLASVSLDGVLHIWDAATRNDIEHDPNTLQALLRLGNWRLEQERYAEAETLFSKVIELNHGTQHLTADELADVRRNLKNASDCHARLMEGLDESQVDPPISDKSN